MIKILVSVDADLASSIALRYACQLADLIGVELQTIHVEEPGKEGYSPGSGWVRQTWEAALLETGREEVNRLIKAEKTSCPVLPPPKMFIGDREEEILRELQRGSYDLFVEGALYTFTAANFYKKIHSRLYRRVPCSVMLVKNLVNPQRVVIVMTGNENVPRLISSFLRIFQGGKVEVDLLSCEFEKRAEPIVREGRKNSDASLQSAEKILVERGLKLGERRVLEGTPEELGHVLKDYGLTVAPIHRDGTKKSDLLELLSRCPSPILLCWQ